MMGVTMMTCTSFMHELLRSLGDGRMEKRCMSSVMLIEPETLDFWDFEKNPDTLWTLLICAGVNKPLIVSTKHGVETPAWVKEMVVVYEECDNASNDDDLNLAVEECRQKLEDLGPRGMAEGPKMQIKFVP
jgi:hypothetical protein